MWLRKNFLEQVITTPSMQAKSAGAKRLHCGGLEVDTEPEQALHVLEWDAAAGGAGGPGGGDEVSSLLQLVDREHCRGQADSREDPVHTRGRPLARR